MGVVCSVHQDRVMRDLTCERVQCDEIWAFCYSKQKNVPEDKKGEFGYGDVWTWVAIDADTKLVPTYHVGSRDLRTPTRSCGDLAKRLRSRVQLTTDGHRVYVNAVADSFKGGVDYAHAGQALRLGRKRCAAATRPPKCIGAIPQAVSGDPDPEHISTRPTSSGRT